MSKIDQVILALPVPLRAKLIAHVLCEPPTQDAPTLLCRVLVGAGVVGVKAGQQMCEDPSVPEPFRKALESLRDKNATVSAACVWTSLPPEIKSQIAAIGPAIGSGSVKQVNLVLLHDGSIKVLAIVHDGAQQDAQNTLQALTQLDDARHIVERLRPMLAREFDLVLEAGAFKRIAETQLGQDPLIHVPEVIYATTSALLRDEAAGPSHAALLRQRELDKHERQRLAKTHEMIVRAALDPDWLMTTRDGERTFVLTDPHLGNVCDDGTRVGLFDPGQYEELTRTEAELFVWLIAALSSAEAQVEHRALLVPKLAALCGNADVTVMDAAYATTFSEPDATVGRKLQLLLLNASKAGVVVPNGYFGLAKMLHSLASQAADLGLPGVIESVVFELFFVQAMKEERAA